jgi:arylsulfatase A-like enzyme
MSITGSSPLPEADGLAVSHDSAGDAAMTDRFLDEVLRRRRPALAVLWLCEPDHTQHGHPLGSPEHLAAVAGADSCAARVAAAVEAEGDDVLLVLCSDHGHETIDKVIPLEAMLIEAGLKAALGSSDLVVASNGTSASIYLSEGSRHRSGEIVEFLRGQAWIGEVYAGPDLAAVGLSTDTPLAIALTPRNSHGPNPHGVPGTSHAIADPLSGDTHVGCGQHGGLGRYEQQPFLFLRRGGFGRGRRIDAPSSPVDIAPTILRHLGLAGDGMDGTPLARA